jgi:SAM-dependent methyltransferase
MHPEALAAMTELLTRYDGPQPADVLDVGAYDVNGTYRPLVEGLGWRYTGLDVAAGPNVDIVSRDPYRFAVLDGRYDVVMTGSTMEHVEAIWLWVPDLVRVLKPGGMLAIVTHWQFPEHRYPVDCWRIMPDGMRYLFDQTRQLRDYQIAIVSPYDIAATAYKVPARRMPESAVQTPAEHAAALMQRRTSWR